MGNDRDLIVFSPVAVDLVGEAVFRRDLGEVDIIDHLAHIFVIIVVCISDQ